ncbi:unnamed protein product, partial [Iphiclides podalirius]
MKSFKLIVHQSSFSLVDLIINLKDYPGLKEKDIVEIYHPENDYPRLLLQVNKVEPTGRAAKDTISVEQSIATTFQLRTFAYVYVNIVNVADVALDSVELTFKDQYLGRSEMWRLKNHLVSTCVYLNKKIEYCGGAIRCQVYEMWSQGDRVACGVITEDTKIVFRSSTSMVYLFIQMSSEMWDFDIHGDLYFEKAVNGFLAELFAKWKKNGSNHEVTIVLFSRTFYKAKSLEEFPQHMKECLQKDYRGRYYEDFYRVAVQNERYDDWSNVLLQLRRLFTDYQKIVLQYHERPNMEIPTAINSTAAQGNFLEVLNMSLNVFEKHYLDRCFDRTGQLSVVITPGVGVFEVDRELTNVTKQRIIDNGVGSDLVCVGEQPLHAVPLLKFHNKDSNLNSIDDYSMPHWINLSFYSTNKKVAYSNFIPRIKLPPRKSQEPLKKMYEDETKGKLLKEDEYMHNSIFDYDAYDAQIFQLPPAHSTCVQRVPRTKKTSVAGLEGISRKSPPASALYHRKMSDPDIHHSLGDMLTGGSKYGGIESNSDTTDSPISINRLSPRSSISINKPVIRTGRALINPFDPSHVKVKLTSNRRRWTHIFPKGPKGVLIQQHHYQARPAGEPTSRNDERRENSAVKENGSSVMNNNHSVYQVDGNIMSGRKRMISASSALGLLGTATSVLGSGSGGMSSGSSGLGTGTSGLSAVTSGMAHRREWTPALTTGVDWKSLTIPACLPITTDYFPDKRSLQNDYLVSDYNLLPDDVNADFAQNRAIYKKPLTTMEVFKELVSQRLAQGFQLIVGLNENEVIEAHCPSTPAPPPSKVAPQSGKPSNAPTKRYLLSIGRIFHKLTLVGSTITVTRYRPRHPYPPFNIHYRYRFHAPNHDTYEVSWVSFTTEKLENYSWNYMDHYICTRGDTDFALVEALKYWRFRTLLLPLTNPATKQILEDEFTHCDIYPTPTRQDLDQLTDGFLKMTEIYFNKVKRPIKQRMAQPAAGAVDPALTRRRHSTSIVTRNAQQVSPTKSINPSQCNKAAAKTVLERTQSQTGETEDTCEDGVIEPKLKANSTLSEIIERMRHPTLGVGFLQQTVSLPSHAFVSIYAIHWLQANMESMTQEKATVIMEKMLQEKMICHASGDSTKRFVVGYYMYHILPQKKDKELTDYVKPLGDLQSFENEWMEVEVLGPRSPLLPQPAGAVDIAGAGGEPPGVPAFLCHNIDPRYMDHGGDSDMPLYKNTHLDIDINNKSDRIEWGHARYQATFRPDQAYEMCIQWAVASGNIVTDLIMGWARKAQNCRLQMVPIPADPLALPFTLKSDPLRGPIYVPLNEEPLLRGKNALFEGFPEETWPERLFLFQEAIAGRFGFIKCTVESTSHEGVGDQLYVHVTGNMFVLIPTAVKCTEHRARARPPNKPLNANRYPVHSEVAPSPHKGYISWHVSGKNKDDYDNSRRMGFLWSWNHMISKKWKWAQPATGDETFQMRILRDFKHFCANHEQSSKARDLICVQSLDATLSFFDQDTFLFMCIFNDILIPGPVSYVASSDFFVICKSTWTLEIYSYQQLREMSELSLRQKKINIPQWTYSAGEEISAVQVIRTSSNFSSIIALGERHLYCFQDNGLMKYIIRFDFVPICFHAYLIGWYYEPDLNPNVNLINEVLDPEKIQAELESVEESLKQIFADDKGTATNLTDVENTLTITTEVGTSVQNGFGGFTQDNDNLKEISCVETHSKERLKLKSLENELNILQRQFTTVQKRLLVQYGSLPPGNCDPLEFLMRDTYERVIKTVQEIIHNREVVCRAGNTLASVGRLIVHILRNTSVDTSKVLLIEEMLSFDLLHDDCQEWEETVTQVAPFVTNKLFKRSEKDKEKLAPVTEQEILSHINLKRFLRQLKSILESVLGKNDDDNDNDNDDVKNSEGEVKNIVRTEELVEVI